MIKMIKGNYGLLKDGQVTAMTKDSDPFEIDPKKEADLIAAGYAVKIDIPVKKSYVKKEDAKNTATRAKPAEADTASQDEPAKIKTNDVKEDIK